MKTAVLASVLHSALLVSCSEVLLARAFSSHESPLLTSETVWSEIYNPFYNVLCSHSANIGYLDLGPLCVEGSHQVGGYVAMLVPEYRRLVDDCRLTSSVWS